MPVESFSVEGNKDLVREFHRWANEHAYYFESIGSNIARQYSPGVDAFIDSIRFSLNVAGLHPSNGEADDLKIRALFAAIAESDICSDDYRGENIYYGTADHLSGVASEAGSDASISGEIPKTGARHVHFAFADQKVMDVSVKSHFVDAIPKILADAGHRAPFLHNIIQDFNRSQEGDGSIASTDKVKLHFNFPTTSDGYSRILTTYAQAAPTEDRIRMRTINPQAPHRSNDTSSRSENVFAYKDTFVMQYKLPSTADLKSLRERTMHNPFEVMRLFADARTTLSGKNMSEAEGSLCLRFTARDPNGMLAQHVVHPIENISVLDGDMWRTLKENGLTAAFPTREQSLLESRFADPTRKG